MIKQGTTLTVQATGEQYTFLETAESSNGKHCKVKFDLKPGSLKPVMHIHQMQDENFEVLSGTYTYEMNGEKKKITVGQSIDLPKGVAHTHYNDEPENCVVVQTVSPALDFEDILARLIELNNTGKIKNGEPPLLEVMVWLKKYKAKTYLAGIPVGIQNAMATVLAPIGRMLGS
ncbi:MAG: cupin domain-containing protein [Chitinophagales bacterium]|nr:cupin domain-containing protein [Chitinophagales bacterium]